MLESILTISLTGFIAGFIFAMPIAGPISILIVSNALDGRRKYSNQISYGAALSDFIYIFVAVYGVTSLYSHYKPAIPYLMLAGALFFILLGYRLFKRPVNMHTFDESAHMTDSIRNSDIRGFYTGFMVNMLNPTQFIGGLISSFFVISLIASMGLNTGGLEERLNNNVKEIATLNGKSLEDKIPDRFKDIGKEGAFQSSRGKSKPYFLLVISAFYATSLSLGGVAWFFLLAWALTRYRQLINIGVLNLLIKVFAICLCLLGLYFAYLGVEQIL